MTSKLTINNSIGRKKEIFKTIGNNQILWYCCGPTVYDAAHMGHARAYISFDIIRRILEKYFNYDVIYIMNITDIDDKIIKRARRNYLWTEFEAKSQFTNLFEFKVYMEDAFKNFDIIIDMTQDQDVKEYRKKLKEIAVEYIGQLTNLENIKWETLQDIIGEYLDKTNGANVTDHSIFFKLTKHWEDLFFEDMKILNVSKPTIVTRISEFIPQVIDIIKKIIDNGYGYESNGSVYFDTMAFSKSHKYAKLVPEAVGDLSMLASGEGELVDFKNEKRSSRDFVLWKASKPGEPFWSSPWGNGRPGWHIECSAMASHFLGENKIMDIHSGGVDLKFPHHDNELAQSEAAFKVDNWVNYFLHAGHLTIEGHKMSKSLKNFITIKDALKNYSANHIRYAFLMHQWDGPLDYSVNVMLQAVQMEKFFQNFFQTIKSTLRVHIDDSSKDHVVHNYQDIEMALYNNLQTCQNSVHKSLCDNFDTQSCLNHLKQHASSVYIYLKDKNEKGLNVPLLETCTNYIYKIISIFGIVEETVSTGSVSGNIDEIAWPYVKLLAEFREKVRVYAKNSNSKELLEECDFLRDEGLVELGIKLEDKEGQDMPAIKFMSKEVILKEREALKNKIQAEKDNKKKLEEEKKLKNEKFSIPAKDYYLQLTDEYSKFDEQGIPTHDEKGEPLSKNALKKVQKMFNLHNKKYETYLGK